MAPSRKSGEEEAKKKKKKKSSEAMGTAKTVATKRKEEAKSKSSNGAVSEPKDLVVPSSSTESQTRKQVEKKGGKFTNQRSAPTNAKTKTEVKTSSKGSTKSESKSKAQSKARLKSRGGEGKEEDEDAEAEHGSAVCAFPRNRIKVIIRSGGPDWRITQEALFLINKASEKFIETCCEAAFIPTKNYFGYKHISSLVSKEMRYDFLLDFVPKRLKAADSLAERQIAEA